MKFINLGSRENASRYVATELFKEIHFNRNAVLGLATGGTMVEMYEELVRLLHLNQSDVSSLETFNLDEYCGIKQTDPNSYMSYMKQHLFNPLNMTESQFHMPDNDLIDVEADNLRYDQMIQSKGPHDIQLLGIGVNGHIGFNEPGTPFDSETRVVNLSDETIEANARFFKNRNEVPVQAVTMGIKTIKFSRRIILLALGEKKAPIIAKLYRMTEPDVSIPASSLLDHSDVEVVIDREAAQFII